MGKKTYAVMISDVIVMDIISISNDFSQKTGHELCYINMARAC